MELSLVVPCHNEESNLVALFDECCAAMPAKPGAEWEMILIDDGSSDATAEIARQLAHEHQCLRAVSLSRNFGKEAAMLAGLRLATGNVTVILDADLQHPPRLIPKMVELLRSRPDVHQVVARRNRTGDSRRNALMANIYYGLVNSLIDVRLENGEGDFRALSRTAVDAICSLQESNRFSKGLFSWIGFNTETIAYDNVSRSGGASSWNTRTLVNYAIDGVVAFNSRPLRAVLYVGVLGLALSLLYIFYLLIDLANGGLETPGYFTLISAVLALGSLQLVALGVIGEYVGRIYLESKERPAYFVARDSAIDDGLWAAAGEDAQTR